MPYTETETLTAALQAGNVVNYNFADNYPTPEVKNAAIVHKDFKIVAEEEGLLPFRRRFRGQFNTKHIPSYFTYVQERIAEEGAEYDRTFVDAANPESSLSATTVLNFGTNDKAGHADDLAILTLRKDPVFENLLLVANNGEATATHFAENLEDFFDAPIKAFNNGEEIKFVQAVAAIRNAKIDVLKSSTLNTSNLEHNASDMEKAAIKAEQGSLPDTLVLTTPLYLGLEAQEVHFKVSVRFIIREGQSTIVQYSLKPIGLLIKYLNAAESFEKVIAGQLKNVSIGKFGLSR